MAIMFGFGYSTTMQKQGHLALGLSLDKVEALAGCEISSDPAVNKCYCTKLYGATGYVCVTTGSGSQPRCCGNY